MSVTSPAMRAVVRRGRTSLAQSDEPPIRSGDLLELLMAAPSEVTVLINNNLTGS
jgi:hypothetical protein